MSTAAISRDQQANPTASFSSDSDKPTVDNQAADRFERALGDDADKGYEVASAAAKSGKRYAEPLPEGQWDPAYNGAVIGQGGRAYDSSVNLAQVPPVVPQAGHHAPTGEQIIFVGGITRDKGNVAGLMQTIANDTGASVYGVHNATSAIDPSGASGAPGDVVESSDDYKEMLAHRSQTDAYLSPNKATDSLADKIEHELLSGKPVNILAESQGALITSNALARVEDRLLERYGYQRVYAPWDTAQAQRNEEALNKTHELMGNITVVSFNGASSYYPDGPNYTHIRNTNDNLVANPLGQGQIGADGGDGARTILVDRRHPEFPSGEALGNHVFQTLWADLTPAQRENITRLNP